MIGALTVVVDHSALVLGFGVAGVSRRAPSLTIVLMLATTFRAASRVTALGRPIP